MSSLFVNFARLGSNPILKSYWHHLSVAVADHQPAIANTLLVWCILLGGYIEEETFWAVDKSYVMAPSPLFAEFDVVYTSDSLAAILSCLSTRVIDVIANGNSLYHLYYLSEFLAAWKKRPECLTVMTYEWCSAISETPRWFRCHEIPIVQPWTTIPGQGRYRPYYKLHPLLQLQLTCQLQRYLLLQDLALDKSHNLLHVVTETEFFRAGPGCYSVHSDGTSHHGRTSPLVALTPSTTHIFSPSPSGLVSAWFRLTMTSKPPV